MSALADGLAVSSGVCLLDLSANALGDTGATSVAMVIVAQQQLGHVRLAGNHFGECYSTYKVWDLPLSPCPCQCMGSPHLHRMASQTNVQLVPTWQAFNFANV